MPTNTETNQEVLAMLASKKNLLTLLTEANFNLVYDDCSLSPEDRKVVDLEFNHLNIKLELHTEDKDQSWALFNHVYKHIVCSNDRKHFCSLPASKRITINNALIEIMNLTDDGLLKSMFMDAFLKCITLDSDNEWTEWIECLDNLKSLYLTIISQRDNKHYFTFNIAEQENAFRSQKRGLKVCDYLDRLFEQDADFYTSVCTPFFSTFEVKALPQDASGDVKVGTQVARLFNGGEQLSSLVPTIQSTIVKDTALKHFEFDINCSNEHLFTESSSCKTYHYVNGVILTNHHFRNVLSEEERQQLLN